LNPEHQFFAGGLRERRDRDSSSLHRITVQANVGGIQVEVVQRLTSKPT
jgi:hypothetical protein